MSKVIGVYGIYCRATDRWYVGASIDVERRIKDHFYDMRTWGLTGERGEMGFDFVKHGLKAFSYTIFEQFSSTERLAERETYWADRKKACTDGYNRQAPSQNRHWRKGT
jgi:group I intron endonuclease